MLRPVTKLSGLQVFEARSFRDDRGLLLQSFVRSDLEARQIPGEFRQAIQSRSRRGVVRGLHFQWEPPQGKLVRCVAGRVHDIVVDLRHGSPTLGDHTALELTDVNNTVVWIPPGFAHGFMALAEDSVVLYFCTEEWNPSGEEGILWNDPALAIAWPQVQALISPKDRQNLTFSAWLEDPRSAAFRFPS